MNGGKHTFSYAADPTVNHHDHLSVQVETQAVTLENMVQAFEAYLLACGYVFPTRHHLDWVEDDGDIGLLDDGVDSLDDKP